MTNREYAVGSPPWRDAALCLGSEPSMWYLEPSNPCIQRALEMCAACPVESECVSDAAAAESIGVARGTLRGFCSKHGAVLKAVVGSRLLCSYCALRPRRERRRRGGSPPSGEVS